MKTLRVILFLFAIVMALGVARFVHKHGIAESLDLLKSHHKVTVVWMPSPGAESYNVYRRTSGGRNYVRIGGSIEPRYVDQTVASGTVYYYVVTALRGNGLESPPSAEIEAAVP